MVNMQLAAAGMAVFAVFLGVNAYTEKDPHGPEGSSQAQLEYGELVQSPHFYNKAKIDAVKPKAASALLEEGEQSTAKIEVGTGQAWDTIFAPFLKAVVDAGGAFDKAAWNENEIRAGFVTGLGDTKIIQSQDQFIQFATCAAPFNARHKTAFNICDDDGSTELSLKEFILCGFGKQKRFAEVDTTGDGQIDFSEFVSKKVLQAWAAADVSMPTDWGTFTDHLFNSFDNEPLSETHLLPDLDRREIMDVLNEDELMAADKNDDGQVDKLEFAAFFDLGAGPNVQRLYMFNIADDDGSGALGKREWNRIKVLFASLKTGFPGCKGTGPGSCTVILDSVIPGYIRSSFWNFWTMMLKPCAVEAAGGLVAGESPNENCALMPA